MYPRYFSYAPVPSGQANGTNAVLPLSPQLQAAVAAASQPQSLSNAAAFALQFLPGCTNAETPESPSSQAQLALLLSALGTNALAPVMSNFGLSDPVRECVNSFNFASTFTGLPMNNVLDNGAGSNNAAVLAGILPLFGQSGVPLTLGSAYSPNAKNTETHTIIRAPVLYKHAATASQSATSSSSGKETSPPDRIVASYAAAAQAAALVRQQPMSNAAEAFLSATAGGGGTSGKGRTRRVRPNRTQVESSFTNGGSLTGGRITESPIPASTKATSATVAQPTWNSAWTRIVSRHVSAVIYIAPDGTRLSNDTELRSYLVSHCAPTAVPISDELLKTNFCFDSQRDTNSVAAPDDRVIQLSFAATLSPVREHGSVSLSLPTAEALEGMNKRPLTTPCRISFNPNYAISKDADEVKRLKLTEPESSSSIEGAPPSKPNLVDAVVTMQNGNLPIESLVTSSGVLETALIVVSANSATSPLTSFVSTTDAPISSIIAAPLDIDPSDAETNTKVLEPVNGMSYTINCTTLDRLSSTVEATNTGSHPANVLPLAVTTGEVPSSSSGFELPLDSTVTTKSNPMGSRGVTKMTTETLTTSTLVPRGAGADSVPAVVASVLPPSSLHTDLSACLGSGMPAHTYPLVARMLGNGLPTGLVSSTAYGDALATAQHQQQLLAASRLAVASRFLQVQQQQVAAVAAGMPLAANTWNFPGMTAVADPGATSGGWLDLNHPATANVATAVLQQNLSAALEQYQRQQALTAAILLQQQQQQQQTTSQQLQMQQMQQLQAYLSTMQQAQQGHGLQPTSGVNPPT